MLNTFLSFRLFIGIRSAATIQICILHIASVQFGKRCGQTGRDRERERLRPSDDAIVVIQILNSSRLFLFFAFFGFLYAFWHSSCFGSVRAPGIRSLAMII